MSSSRLLSRTNKDHLITSLLFSKLHPINTQYSQRRLVSSTTSTNSPQTTTTTNKNNSKDSMTMPSVASLVDSARAMLPGSTDPAPLRSYIHRDPLTNQDLGLSLSNRDAHGIRGLMPAALESLGNQVKRALIQLRSKDSAIEKHIYLSNLRQTNVRLFYKIVTENLTEVAPLIYTPTVGEACERYSEIYRRPEGLFISIEDKGSIRQVLENWPNKDKVRISVVTDGSRILGLGDLGLGGMGISIGKLSLYVAGAGIHPEQTLPIVLDMGTDNSRLLEDPLYLGLRQKRRSIAENEAFLDEFMEAMKAVFPDALVQFEDFSSEAAFHYLERYQDKYCTFNDDIQGTASVIYTALINAAVQASKISGLPLSEHKIVFLGAGSAAVGVAKQLVSFFTTKGLSPEEARKRIYLVDTKGLITNDRGDKLAEHKKFFSRDDNEGKQYKSLEDVVDSVQPSVLIGLSTTQGAFTEDIVRKMAQINPRPIVFPLSNPLTKCELTFQDALDWTEGRVIFASGSPFDPIEFNGEHREAAQGNNFYIFPALGQAVTLCGATRVTEKMLETTSIALSEALTPSETAANLLYPRIDRIQEISAQVAARVIQVAQKQKVDRRVDLRGLSLQELVEKVKEVQYKPAYEFTGADSKL
ncbi:malate dehydrogenase [Phaffia rhodozyma]|uniref:Malate dehydrogenase n=1 Tax=Phaffia rhodozyma TaxID=264483 RepID=A0A0F7STG3_PHARH|nr:malate dehydrogenase [Phaffia rhodozyma]